MPIGGWTPTGGPAGALGGGAGSSPALGTLGGGGDGFLPPEFEPRPTTPSSFDIRIPGIGACRQSFMQSQGDLQCEVAALAMLSGRAAEIEATGYYVCEYGVTGGCTATISRYGFCNYEVESCNCPNAWITCNGIA